MRVLALITAALLLPLSALASTTYTYTGKPFTTVAIEPYHSTYFITGSFTVDAPLADGLAPFTPITPTSFSFSDGVQTITDTTPGIASGFSFGTSDAGSISSWNINLTVYHHGPDSIYQYSDWDGIQSFNPPSEWVFFHALDFPYIGASHGKYTAYAVKEYDPGTWSVTDTPVSPTPEPASLTLAATGLLSLAGLARQKTRR